MVETFLIFLFLLCLITQCIVNIILIKVFLQIRDIKHIEVTVNEDQLKNLIKKLKE